MNVFRWHPIYRMTAHETFEIGLGAGQVVLSGNEVNTGNSFTMPILYHRKHWGIEYRPSLISLSDSRLSEHDVAALLTKDHYSLKLAYRWFMSESMELSGPYFGVSYHFRSIIDLAERQDMSFDE